SLPSAQTVSAPAQPPTISHRPPAPPIQSHSPDFNTPPISPATSDSFVSVDPFEQWQQLARLGSYGNTGSTETELATAEAFESDRLPTGTTVASAVPAAYFAQTSATIPAEETAPFRDEVLLGEASDTAEKESLDKPAEEQSIESLPKTEARPVLEEAEARILEEQNLDNTRSIQSLVIGSQAVGELVTPVVLDNEGVGDHFMVVLSEPLMDNASHRAIPASSLLMVQVDRVAENGLVQLSATEAIWEEQGFQRELVLPRQTILIRGNGGDPLVAESYGDTGGDIAAMDMGQFALGAIRRVGELYTRSDARVQTGDGTTIITESNPAPNILAGALEGGSEAILDAISDRNQQAIEKLRERPRVPYLPAGTPVQAFVNQSIQMPSGF
ncbi:MAG: hypothetical protein AAFY72_06405, partial [Cyanobacteria bacterium J06649_4]